jgi:hypothetical protein
MDFRSRCKESLRVRQGITQCNKGTVSRVAVPAYVLLYVDFARTERESGAIPNLITTALPRFFRLTDFPSFYPVTKLDSLRSSLQGIGLSKRKEVQA